jgi:predicted component of type VI protein secretion system
MNMPPQLVALTEGPSILLDKPIMLLGRHQECDIQLGSRKISRRHCCIAQVNDYIVVRDLGSTNGIRINGIRVVEGSLRPGDELTIGNQRYQVQWTGQPREPSLAPIPAVKANGGKAEEDARLESSDSPVALKETAAASGVLAGQPVIKSKAGRAGVGASGEPPVVLPDDIKLSPLSSEQPPSKK